MDLIAAQEIARLLQQALTIPGNIVRVATLAEQLFELLGLSAKPDRIPDGTPHIRDIDDPCEEFEPGEREQFPQCQSDGHYLCKECRHYKEEEKEES